MKALAGTACALLAAGCWTPGTLVSQRAAVLHPYAPPPAFASFAPDRDAAAVPVVALPAELFAPEVTSVADQRPVITASLESAHPGLTETSCVVPADAAPSEQGPMLIPSVADTSDDAPLLIENNPSTMTAWARSMTMVENPAARIGAIASAETTALRQPGPAIIQPGAPETLGPANPPIVAPGGPAVIDPAAPILLPDRAMPWSGGPCETCSPWGVGDSCGPCGPGGPGASCGCPCDAVCNRAGFAVFGEFLFLSARGVDVPFATPVNGPGANAVPIGNTRVADPAYDPGFRVGGTFAFSPRTSLLVVYTNYESSVNDLHTLPGGTGFLRATLVHSNTASVAADSLSAEADYDIDFRFGDVALSRDFWRDCESRVSGVAGFRYGELDQDLRAVYSILGVTIVDSDLEFEGFGPRIGIDAERFLQPPLSLYGNAFVNFLAGSFDGSYVQQNLGAPGAPQAAAGFEDDRIVTLLEAEVGIAWHPACGWWRASVGYYVAGWFNVVTTSEFIQAVQADDFSDMSDTLTFDGLTARLHFEF